MPVTRIRCAATVPASSRPAAISTVRRATATSPLPPPSRGGGESASPTSRSDGPKLCTPWDHRPWSKAAGSDPKPMRSKSSSGEFRWTGRRYSSMTRLSSCRWIEVRTSGTASEMNPGLLPVLWIEVPPCRQAASIRSRRSGSMLGRDGGTRHSVVTTFDAGLQQAAHVVRRRAPAACTARSRPPVRGSRRSDRVARTPVGPERRTSSPASLAGLVLRVHVEPGQRHVGVLDHPAQRRGHRCCRWPTGPPGTAALTLGHQVRHSYGVDTTGCHRLSAVAPLPSASDALYRTLVGQAHVGGVDQLAVPPMAPTPSASELR